jgi:hypothetical protein
MLRYSTHKQQTSDQTRTKPNLTTETVQGPSLALERVDHVHGGDRLPPGVLGIGHGVSDHILEEDLEHATRLLVDQAADALDSATPGEAADGGLGDALDVISEHLPVTLGASLSQSLASLASTRHCRRLRFDSTRPEQKK